MDSRYPYIYTWLTNIKPKTNWKKKDYLRVVRKNEKPWMCSALLLASSSLQFRNDASVVLNINYCETYIGWFVDRALNRATPTHQSSSYAVSRSFARPQRTMTCNFGLGFLLQLSLKSNCRQFSFHSVFT